LTIEFWNRQIESWIDVFSVDEPDLKGLELVKEFDNLAEKFYGDFADDFSEYTESEIQVGFIVAGVREEVDFVIESSYPTGRPTDMKRTGRKVESIPVSVFDKTDESRIEENEKYSPEEFIVSDKDLRIVLQLPINNKKKNIKVVANDDNSITIFHLNYEGRRCSRTLDILYDINFETTKATYRNGILEVTFDR
jgi:HSP20 family molecular chaperone IbpA